MRMAHYKPFHEPSREQIEEPVENTLRRIDRHDLIQLRDFWRGELKSLQGVAAIPGKAPQPLPQDLALVQWKLERLNAELRRREDGNETS